MIKSNNVYYWFESEKSGRRYELYEMTSIMCHWDAISTTSDIICIWDDEEKTMVNWVYGASDLADKEFDEQNKYITDFVEDYELQHGYTSLHPVDEDTYNELTNYGCF